MKPKSLFYYIKLLIILTAGCLASCSDRPSNVLSEKKMVKLIVDMELAEAYVNTQSSSTNEERIEMGKKVLEAHGVSEESLDTTLAWYGRNLDEYTELYDKVDKEIAKRRKHYTEVPGQKPKEANNLWPYTQHLVLSPQAENDAFIFTLQNPEVEKGEIITLSFNLPNSSPLKGTLGVEYTDGIGEATVSNFTKNHVEISLQTDSAKEIKKLYGVMHFKENPVLPIYIDSIMIKKMEIDTLEYLSKRRTLKRFSPMQEQPKPEKKDTVNSSVSKDIKKDEVNKESGSEIHQTPSLKLQKEVDGNEALPGRQQNQKFEKLKKNS